MISVEDFGEPAGRLLIPKIYRPCGISRVHTFVLISPTSSHRLELSSIFISLRPNDWPMIFFSFLILTLSVISLALLKLTIDDGRKKLDQCQHRYSRHRNRDCPSLILIVIN